MARLRPLLAALVLACVVAAGCVQAPAARDERDDPFAGTSVSRYDVLPVEHVPLEGEGGATLDTWVFRPDTSETGEKVPVIINFSPYWHNLAPPAQEGGDAFSLYLIEYYVPRGYAVALSSARGTGLSEGCFTIGGPQEVDDIDRVVTHLAQQSWSNGNASAIAKSYDGTMAQAALLKENPHLRTIVPVSAISEFYKYNYYGGVPYDFGGLLFNTYYVGLVSAGQGVDPFSPSADPDPATYERMPTRFCEESAQVQTSQYHSAFTGDYSPYWQARNYTAQLPDRVDASVFYVHGLQDWNVKPDHMVPWIDELRARGATVKMWLGQWEHDYPHRDDWNATLLRWHDHYLKGLDTGILDEPLVQVQDDAGVWRDEPEWPPARARTLALHPSADGSLAAQPGTGTSSYADRRGASGVGPASVEGVGAVVAFTTAPYPEGLRIVGSPVLHAKVAATAPRATLSVTLLVDDRVVDQGFLDLAHRDGLEKGEPATPGAVYDVVVPLYPQDLVVPPGATLTLLVGHLPPEEANVQVQPFSGGAVVTLHHGEGTWLALPVLDLEDVAPEEPQPESVGCWTC